MSARGAGLPRQRSNPSGMATVKVSRTLVKSLPELWAELEGNRLAEAVGAVKVRSREPERVLAWEAEGASGTAVLEPAGWGTKVILTARVNESGRPTLRQRVMGRQPPPPRHPDIETKLRGLLEDLGSAHRRPFARVE